MSKKAFLILVLIIILASSLRLFKLSEIPPGLGRDEASIGYNAYSILTTGKDEYGRLLPLSFEAFGDWKLPVSIYLTIPFIKIFGLTEEAVRLPVALFGIFSIPLIYLLARKIGFGEITSLVSSLFLAISPWHIYMSRTGFGHNVIALFFFISGLILFLKYSKWGIFKFLSLLLFTISMFTYVSFTIFAIPFILFLIISSNDAGKKITIAIFTILSVLAVRETLFANIAKIPGTSVMNDTNVNYWLVDKKRNEHFENSFIVKFLHNKYTASVYKTGINYLNSFSPSFLFEKGGENPINNLEEMGNMYLIDGLLISVGLFILIRNKNQSNKILFPWLLLAAIPSSITKDAPHSTRLLTILPPLCIISAYGFVSLFKYLLLNKNKYISLFKLPVIILIMSTLFFSYYLFLDYYFIHFPLNRSGLWNYGIKEAVRLENSLKPEKVVIANPFEYYYIYFLFYNAYNPVSFQKEQIRGQITWDGFHPIKSFGKYYITDSINWKKSYLSKNTFYLTSKNKNSKCFSKSGVIRRANNDIAFYWYFSGENIQKICQ